MESTTKPPPSSIPSKLDKAMEEEKMPAPKKDLKSLPTGTRQGSTVDEKIPPETFINPTTMKTEKLSQKPGGSLVVAAQNNQASQQYTGPKIVITKGGR